MRLWLSWARWCARPHRLGRIVLGPRRVPTGDRRSRYSPEDGPQYRAPRDSPGYNGRAGCGVDEVDVTSAMGEKIAYPADGGTVYSIGLLAKRKE